MRNLQLILLTSSLLLGSQVISPQSKTGDLPVIDISKGYPKKDIRLQDIADLEYIALETTDDVLLSDKSVLSYVSDKYILIYEFVEGDIFVFHRTGKIYAHFNHKGQSGWEYPLIGEAGVIFDEKNEEVFVCSQSIQVYSLRGEYKRTLKINAIQNELKVFNFNDEALLVYDDVIVDLHIDVDPKTKPYSLISKKDGGLISVLDIHLPKRYSNRIVEMLENNRYRVNRIYFTGNMYYGQDFMIADISSDTLYLLTQNRKLTPLLIRKPSVHASDPRTVWITFLTTDKFVLIGKIPLIFNSRGGKIPVMMYEFETGIISDVSFLDLDAELMKRRWGPGGGLGGPPAIAKNRTAELIWPTTLINAYKEKQLKGDVEKFAKTLDEDDNPIVRIIKFK